MIYKFYWIIHQFRTEFLQRMVEYMDNELKQKYSDLLFTLIYPIKMDQGRDLWFYLRVSQGIIDLDDFEPVFYRTCDEDNIQFEENNEHCKLQVKVQGFGGGDNAADKVAKMVDNGSSAINAASSAVSLFQNLRR